MSDGLNNIFLFSNKNTMWIYTMVKTKFQSQFFWISNKNKMWILHNGENKISIIFFLIVHTKVLRGFLL